MSLYGLIWGSHLVQRKYSSLYLHLSLILGGTPWVSYSFSERMVGKSSTSLIAGLLVSSIVSLSMP